MEEGGGTLCFEIGFYVDISKESRCESEIKVCAHFYKILLIFKVPQVKGMPGKSLTHQKMIKNASNLASHIIGIVCVKQIVLGSAKT